jgi:CheY-like chemotaxis protein
MTHTILLVDDDPSVLSLTRDVLELEGVYTILEAGSGEEALNAEQQWPGPIHLLLTDIVMPGLTGPELARLLAPRRPDMKVLYMSAFTMVHLQDQRIEVEPGVPLVAKPFRVEDLTTKVRDVLTPRSVFAQPNRARPATPETVPAAGRPVRAAASSGRQLAPAACTRAWSRAS